MKDFFEGVAGLGFGAFFVAFFLLGQFPGGTIFMALMCDSRRLDGWDWVLSVIIPFYGLIKGMMC